MNDLPEQMRAATDDAPPTRIDLDSFIAREQRRSRLLRWGGASTATAVLVAALVAVPALYAGGGTDLTPALGGTVCPTPGPNPTEGPYEGPPATPPSARECAATVQRLAAALRELLAVTTPGQHATPRLPGVFVYQPRYAQYEADVDLSGPGGAGFLRVVVAELTEDPPSRIPTCPESAVFPDRGCSYEIVATGGVTIVNDSADTLQAQAYRADGTLVTVSVNMPGVVGASDGHGATRPHAVVLLTGVQLIDIAEAPGLSLFPGRSPSPRPTRDPDAEQLLNMFVLRLRERLPVEQFELDPVTGSASTGYRTAVTVIGQGSVSVEMWPTCSGAGCKQPPPCPGERDGTSCTVRGDGSRVTVRDESDPVTRVVRVYPAGGRVVEFRVEGGLASRLTADHLAAIADGLYG